MSKSFDAYSKYYDLLYREKNYEGEMSYVVDLLEKYSGISVNSILELGCGTGGHAKHLSRYNLLGIDRSETMIRLARDKHKENHNFAFEVADIRFFKEGSGARFDAVISLFHVVSYLTSNNDLMQTFKTVRSHLKAGGVFIFDFWYGPAVLTDLPSVKFKELEDGALKVNRVSLPSVRFNENIVDVLFKLTILEKDVGAVSEIEELHSMRYLFMPEIENLLGQAGFKIKNCFGWLTRKKPSENTWSVVCIAVIK